ncbi:hypothetical protein [Streptosporangium saharense]|uniref:restriction endonuclease subunit S n=1 Tax=Streptosporangium saharense TaxID=1706840 RepID=UPI0033311ECF
MTDSSKAFRQLLTETKDGDWGKGEPTEGYMPVHVIRGTDFSDVKLGNIANVPLRFLSEKTVHRRLLQADDILIETAGGSRDRPTGRTLLITQETLDRFSGPVTCASFARFLRINSRAVNPRYLYWYLQHLYARGDMWVHQVQHTGVARFQFTRFAESEMVPLIRRSEQEGIESLLGVLDDKITINERIAATYEGLLQCRYNELGLADEPADESAVPITDLIAFNPKLGKPSVDEPVYVDMAALQTGKASIPTWTRRAPKSGPRFMNGDTLLARITPCLENGKTGYVDFMEDGEIGLGSTEFIVMRSLAGIPSELSYFLARDSRFREHAIRNMVGTSGRQRVSAADAANYFVNLPDADALTAFGNEASATFAHMKSLQSESRALAALRDILLPQLMSGRLHVRDAEKIVEDAK